MGAAKRASVEGPRAHILLGDEGFPAALARIPNPPKELFVVGSLDAVREGLAVVGARKATPYGRNVATLFAGRAAAKGVAIISGGACGCDAQAHVAALDEGGTTVAFLGGGCDRLYPASNRALFQRIVDSGGALVSEYAWDVDPKPYAFRMRNRLIAGLARATLIVEAGLPSGTFSTADEALSANKEVLVVPGSIFSPTSRGANMLLFQGAIPIVDESSFDAVLAQLFPEVGACAQGQLPLDCVEAADGCDDAVLAALAAEPMRLERLVELLESEQGSNHADALREIVTHVALLETQGKVERFPDGRFGAVCPR